LSKEANFGGRKCSGRGQKLNGVRAKIVFALGVGSSVVAVQLARHNFKTATVYAATAKAGTDWPTYNGQAAGDHYSALSQINRTNVSQLKEAWRFDTGEVGGLQTNPLVIGRMMYLYSPSQKILALNAATGKVIWTFNAGVPGQQPNRGMCYWTDGKESRLLASVMDHLYALDPLTGRVISSFGEHGAVDLRKDLGEADYTKTFAVMTTPGVLYKDLIITGFRTSETQPAPRGDIRAYDVRTGKLRWSFHTIPHPGEPGYETWPKDGWKVTGSANNWTGMSVDEKRGIVYVPTGSAVTDFYGADRVGDDLFANTLLALDANTGRLIWHFQGVHHDIWDRDFPSPPALVTVKQNDRRIDAVAQTTKHGFLFLFDRTTGKPLFPIQERPFPASDVPGEVSSPTQPIPLMPAPYARQRLTAEMLTQRTPEAHAWALEQFKNFRSDGLFVPFAIDKQTIILPGFDGGAEWGGSAVDPRSGVIYINSNDVAWTGGLTLNRRGRSPGETTYLSQCSACHGTERGGSPPAFPSLVDIQKTLSDAEITSVVRQGKGRMPSSPNIDDANLRELLIFLHTKPDIAGGSMQPGSSASVPIAGNRNEKIGAALYDKNCAICHSEDLLGGPSNYPGLVGVRGRLGDAQILNDIHDGKGRMPAFPKLNESDTSAILRFLGGAFPQEETSSKKEGGSTFAASEGIAKYRFTGYRKFLDPDGYPAIVPPWGTLNAIDLNSGKYLWKVPLGEYPELAAKGMKNTGTENYGGPIVTAGGLVIIGATIYDRKIRAYTSDTGRLLWTADLPFAGVATPATYMVDGKQYIVIATSGQRDPKGPQGGAYIAFALP
jgi:glucose dehydrogenase